MLDVFRTLNISASGLTAQRARLDVIASNIANAETTRSDEGGPYRRKTVVFREVYESAIHDAGYRNVRAQTDAMRGVEIAAIEADKRPFRWIYDPSHPDANEEGYVQMPNVNVLREMVDLINAQRSYEANVTALNATKSFVNAALQIGKGG
ncbi:MAG TPA: flagellar basal body rod protein FlgC [Thermotogota bacterium]|jgi:flagellar basal-body rod protein FlgC|nr:flagellar basal body rod protein FlgC [Thermotogota bacterium]NLH18892.1 flagellar basal body rod protein FlgC [Thermotogaceae bacterium]OQC32921.1 MAG: Flagellar basal-body rod protein FlgC [Thermotogota bacterium ADurb.Bin062]HNW46049.1 flagellar basal body rod protein FlgC [Thermotogota bacterium]HNY82084.1 flagellar basal body rod protein FlgC [Thermotogota bacterium]